MAKTSSSGCICCAKSTEFLAFISKLVVKIFHAWKSKKLQKRAILGVFVAEIARNSIEIRNIISINITEEFYTKNLLSFFEIVNFTRFQVKKNQFCSQAELGSWKMYNFLEFRRT